MKIVFIPVVFIFCLALFLPGGSWAKSMYSGYPSGEVLRVDRDAGLVSVSLGAKDMVMKGMPFTVLDGSGGQAASIFAGDVYIDLFWSRKVAPEEMRKIKPGMEVRWFLTPEVVSLTEARRQGTPELYKGFVCRYPQSPYLPDLLRGLPDPVLRELNPDFYDAWKAYTKDAFQQVVDRQPGSCFAEAARAEIKAIEAYDAEQERIKAERAKRAAEAEAERKRQETIETKAREMREQKQLKREALGKLINNSPDAVRFVFKEPDEFPPTAVLANSSVEARHQTGSYTYEVYKAEETFPPAFPGEKQEPLKTGAVDIEFDLWEATYP